MTYQSVWWYPNYTEYGAGLNSPKTWPRVLEQYRRPHALYDLRRYELPVDEYQSKLYYDQPRLGRPAYRGTFRDKPHTVPRHYPDGRPEGQPSGFFGRVYYEHGPPPFKHDGPRRDKLFWIERDPFLPSFGKRRAASGKERAFDTLRGLNPPSASASSEASRAQARHAASATYGAAGSRPTTGSRPNAVSNPTKRITQDGVGYL